MIIYGAYGGPEIIKGLVRDIRPVWALEEIGADYKQKWLDTRKGEQRSDVYRAINPFGKVPAMVDGDVTLFESAAICFYIANKYGQLTPSIGSTGYFKVQQWAWAAVDNVMPPLFDTFIWTHFMSEHPSAAGVVETRKDVIKARLEVMDKVLADTEFLVGNELTIADIMMGSVLRNGLNPNALDPYENVSRYGETLWERPAFKRAYEANLSGPTS